jgi:hypothetical protein
MSRPLDDIARRLTEVEAELQAIRQRNKRVESEKAWEQSWFRVGWIVFLTYVLTAAVFWLIGVHYFMLNALVPTLGYVLSTQSLPFVRRWWLRRYVHGDDGPQRRSDSDC